MAQKWSVREYREGDEAGIFRLREAVTGKVGDKQGWMRWWHWMHRDNPYGGARMWLAEDDGKIVGHYALIPAKLSIENNVVRAYWNIDVMTHPDYRGQGVFHAVETKALSEAKKEQVFIICGFPNDAAYPGHLKSGWFHICDLEVMVKPLNNLKKILGRRIRNRFLLALGIVLGNLIASVFCKGRRASRGGDVTEVKVSSFDDRIDNLRQKVTQRYPIICVKDREYLNWRYCQIPDVKYTIYVAEKEGTLHGYVVFRYIESGDLRFGYIFDLVSDEDETACHLISKVEDCLKQEKADLILCQMLADKAYHKTFRRAGFLPLPRFIMRRHFGAYSTHPSVPKDFLKNPEHWFIQLGDSDAL